MALLLGACTAVVPPSEPPHDVSRLDASEAVLFRFVDAYNAGRLDDAMALVDDTIVGSDCDYRTISAFSERGAAEFRGWLAARIADRDRLLGATIESSADALAVSFRERWSDTLRGLGYPNGIAPKLAAKVAVFDGRIRAFAFGPLGGDQDLCRPS